MTDRQTISGNSNIAKAIAAELLFDPAFKDVKAYALRAACDRAAAAVSSTIHQRGEARDRANRIDELKQVSKLAEVHITNKAVTTGHDNIGKGWRLSMVPLPLIQQRLEDLSNE
jgi:hypothetical protein